MTVATEPGIGTAALWRLLSLGFTAPTEETLAEMCVLAEALAELPDAAPELADLVAELHSTKVERLSAVHQGLFGGKVQVPPYEGSYELDPIRQGRQMADIAAFYRAFGAEAHGPAAERPDHAGCELEFLAFLELRRLAAVEEGDETGAEIVDEITTTFLADHTGRWLPGFFATLYEAAAHSRAYRTLAVLGAGALEGELVRRGIEATPAPRHRPRLSVEADSFPCGAADSATGLLGR